jgi:HPt (histidine-containing phosphotransfer) domain-containing protein
MRRLRQEYLAEVPARLAELQGAIAAWTSGRQPPVPLATLFHRLSGSAGAYGFSGVTAACRSIEQWLATQPAPGAEAQARLEQAVAEVSRGFDAGPTAPDISR